MCCLKASLRFQQVVWVSQQPGLSLFHPQQHSTSTCCSNPALSHLLAGLPLLVSTISNYLDSASNLRLLKQAWDDTQNGLNHPLLSSFKWLIQEHSVYFLVLVSIFAFLKLVLAKLSPSLEGNLPSALPPLAFDWEQLNLFHCLLRPVSV